MLINGIADSRYELTFRLKSQNSPFHLRDFSDKLITRSKGAIIIIPRSTYANSTFSYNLYRAG